MSDSGSGRSGNRRATRIAGLAALVLAVAAVPVQLAFLGPVVRTHLTARHEHNIRRLLIAAADRIPDGARYAITSAAREPNAVYFLGPAVDVRFTGSPEIVRRRLEIHRIRYVIILRQSRPRALASGDASWYRLIVRRRAGEVVEVLP
jgi:hypothetical protein